MKQALTGGCLCGAVRYECEAQPTLAEHCQCRLPEEHRDRALIPRRCAGRSAQDRGPASRLRKHCRQREHGYPQLLSDLRIFDHVPDFRLTEFDFPDCRQLG